MKFRITTLLCCLFFATSLQAQSVDDILKNYFENTGGLDKWKSLKSTKMSGVMGQGGMEFPGTIYAQAPNLQKVDVDINGKNFVQAYDGKTAWMINPFMGGENAQKMPDEMAEDMVDQQFEDDFINYKEKGHTVELEGKEEVEGAETFKVKLTKKNGNIEYYFFETEYFVPIMVRTPIKSGPGKGQMSETYLSDYQEVDGLMFPFFMETKMAGESMQKITIKEIVLNKEQEVDFFAFPQAEGEQAEDKEAAPKASDMKSDKMEVKEDAKEAKDMKDEKIEEESKKKKKKKRKKKKG